MYNVVTTAFYIVCILYTKFSLTLISIMYYVFPSSILCDLVMSYQIMGHVTLPTYT